jgi:hypothetical protein
MGWDGMEKEIRKCILKWVGGGVLGIREVQTTKVARPGVCICWSCSLLRLRRRRGRGNWLTSDRTLGIVLGHVAEIMEVCVGQLRKW